MSNKEQNPAIAQNGLLAEVPLELQKYLAQSFNEVASVEKGVKKTSQYGGSIFVIFNSGRTYRLNFQLYNSEVCLDGAF